MDLRKQFSTNIHTEIKLHLVFDTFTKDNENTVNKIFLM